jgi:hypothetical protein
MAFQIRYYKSRQQQQRALIDRLKRDTAELKKYWPFHLSYIWDDIVPRANDILAQENAQFRQHFGYQNEGVDAAEPSGVPNSNGKRPMNERDQ